MSRWCVVVPSNRPNRLEQFKADWEHLFTVHDATLIPVPDLPPWEGIPEFIPRYTDMIRSWGFYQAWQQGCELILSLDDDVHPDARTDLFAEYERVFDSGAPLSDYLSVGSFTDSDQEMRGFPYAGRDATVTFQYGGWNGMLDFDAATQIVQRPRMGAVFWPRAVPVPRGTPTTCCAMNFAFRAYRAPLAWQLPLLDGRYNRTGDIWSGLIQKRVLDACGEVMVVNGRAAVIHERASDPWANLRREAPGMEANEMLWAALVGVLPAEPGEAFVEVTNRAAMFFTGYDPEYAEHFRTCRDQWLELFQ